MIVLDSDHLTILHYLDHPRCLALKERLRGSETQIRATVISLEEGMRGWLAQIKRRQRIVDQIHAYERLARMVTFFQKWQIETLDERAASEFDRLKKSKVRVGTQDLKIAAITLANDALLLSANLRDFGQVPGLRVENWLN